MLGKTTYVSSVLKNRIFPLLYITDLGIFRTKLRSLRGSDTLGYRLQITNITHLVNEGRKFAFVSITH